MPNMKSIDQIRRDAERELLKALETYYEKIKGLEWFERSILGEVAAAHAPVLPPLAITSQASAPASASSQPQARANGKAHHDAFATPPRIRKNAPFIDR